MQTRFSSAKEVIDAHNKCINCGNETNYHWNISDTSHYSLNIDFEHLNKDFVKFEGFIHYDEPEEYSNKVKSEVVNGKINLLNNSFEVDSHFIYEKCELGLEFTCSKCSLYVEVKEFICEKGKLPNDIQLLRAEMYLIENTGLYIDIRFELNIIYVYDEITYINHFDFHKDDLMKTISNIKKLLIIN